MHIILQAAFPLIDCGHLFMSIQKALTVFLKAAWFPNLPTQAPRAGPLGHFQFVCYYTPSCKESRGPCPVISLGKTLRNGICGSKACPVKMFMCARDGHSVRPGRASACRALCFLQATPRWATLSLPPGAGYHCGSQRLQSFNPCLSWSLFLTMFSYITRKSCQNLYVPIPMHQT